MPTVITQGAASAKGYGFGASSTAANYIEDVFSTYLYTGNGSTQTITNGVDLSGKGGLVWCKSRSTVSYDHLLFDTVRGVNKSLNTTLTSGEQTTASSLTAFNSTGFSLGSAAFVNGTGGGNFVGWSFRKQVKFFDVVTYTGNGANRTIAHNLGSVPGCIIVKRTDTAADWQVYHRSLASTQYMVLNTTAAVATGTTRWNSTTPTSTVFSLGTDTTVNANGGTYVAYLFAHDAGGFGAAGTDNVISCGSFTGDGVSGSGATVNLGYEPQFLLVKRRDSTSAWYVYDNMRGMPATVGGAGELEVNTSSSENTTSAAVTALATGFKYARLVTGTYIYIAIRRGPMKKPTSGTSVFNPISSGTSDGKVTTGWPADALISTPQANVSGQNYFGSRLQGNQLYMTPTSTSAETTYAGSMIWNTVQNGYENTFSNSVYNPIADWAFRRSPGFFDEVCYTGTGIARTINHNLGVAPELMIVKLRNDALGWQVYSNGISNTEYLVLNTTAAKATGTTRWNSTTPTASSFSLGTANEVNANGFLYVAYLFATCPGVSKVGSYTGTAGLQTINCNFSAGARFVLIKRADSTGDWYVWDSARGITSGNDPYLLLNSTASQVSGTNYVDTTSVGFQVTAAAPAALNASGGTYIFLAIA